MRFQKATLADLRREGTAVLLTVECPKPELDPDTGEELDDGAMEPVTMQVPMSALREWLKGEPE